MATATPMPSPLDLVRAAVARAPVGEPFTPEQRAELDKAVEDIAAGRTQLVEHDDVPAWLEAHAAQLGQSP